LKEQQKNNISKPSRFRKNTIWKASKKIWSKFRCYHV